MYAGLKSRHTLSLSSHGRRCIYEWANTSIRNNGIALDYCHCCGGDDIFGLLQHLRLAAFS